LLHLDLIKDIKTILYSLTSEGVLPAIDRTFDLLSQGYKPFDFAGHNKVKAGALGMKHEGGGKVRLFAMVDF
jgi:environmental stress-induced protein Ves